MKKRNLDDSSVLLGKFNGVMVEAVTHLTYNNGKAAKQASYFRVYTDGQITYGGVEHVNGDYTICKTPSEAARKINNIIKNRNNGKIPNITNEQVKELLDRIVSTAQKNYEYNARVERMEKFIAELNELMLKHKMHFEINEDHDYYANWNYYNIVDEISGEDTDINDVLEQLENTAINNE